MNKKLITLVITIAAFATNVSARNGYNSSSCPKFYLGISSGINNHSGFLGVNFDVPVTTQFSLGTGVGLSSWGYKAYGEGRFYFKECNRGWALGAAFTYNTGLQDIAVDMPTTIGTTEVVMDWEPSPNVAVSAYHFFNLGRGGHRFYLQLGWSQAIVSTPYVVTSGHTLDSDGVTAMNLLSPGGLIFGFGFSFGLGGR